MTPGTASGGSSGSAGGRLCLSGATGFIGSCVLAHLARDCAHGVTVLVRDARRLPDLSALPGLRTVEGDVADESAWARALEPGQTVIHLAAATGRAPWTELHRVNVGGTQRLVRVAAGVADVRILYVSSIAARFPDRRWYPYAATKVAAEELVRTSGLPYAILRPTLVLGAGSPIEAALRRLARLRLPVFPGSGRVLTQPVQVDDLAGTILATARSPAWGAIEGDVGGPRTLPMRALVEELVGPGSDPHRDRIPLPLTPLRAALALLEGLTGRRRSFGSGQLCAFANDSVALHPFEIPDGRSR